MVGADPTETPGVNADMPGVNAEDNNWHNCLGKMPDANAWKNAWFKHLEKDLAIVPPPPHKKYIGTSGKGAWRKCLEQCLEREKNARRNSGTMRFGNSRKRMPGLNSWKKCLVQMLEKNGGVKGAKRTWNQGEIAFQCRHPLSD